MAQAASIRPDEADDLGTVVARVRRHVAPALLGGAAGLALAWTAAALMPRQYTASAKLDYSPQETTGELPRPQSDLLRDAQIDAQVQTAKSLPVAVRTVRKLRLEHDPAFAPSAEAARNAGVPPEQALASALLRKVEARRIGKTTLFEVSYTGRDPVQAARIADALAAGFLEAELARKLDEADDVGGRLGQRLSELRGEVEAADNALAAFRVRSKLLGAPDSAAMEHEVSAIRGQLAIAQAQAAQAAVRGSAGGLNTVVAGSAVGPGASALGELRSQRAEAAAQLAALSPRVGPLHPAYLGAQEKVQAIDAQIAREMASLSRTARVESSAAGSGAASLSASLAAAESRLAGAVKAGVELGTLERRAQNARAVYQQVLASSVDQNADRALIRPDTRLAAPATVPLEPTSPNQALAIVMGLLLGVSAGAALSVGRARWTQRVATGEDITNLLGQRHVGSIPTPASVIEGPHPQDPADAVTIHPQSAFAEAFRNLAANLGFAARVRGGKVFGIASALPGEGKTTTALGLARVLAGDGARVVLIDADLRRRSLSQRLRPHAEAGLCEMLQDRASLEEVLLGIGGGLDFVPLAANSSAPRLLQSGEFAPLLDRLRRRYDYVIVDTAPLLAVADSRFMLAHFDATAVLARWRITPVKAVRAALDHVAAAEGRVAGIALTMVDLRSRAPAGHADAYAYAPEMKRYYRHA